MASEAAKNLYELQVKGMPSPPTRSPRVKTRRATCEKVVEQPEVSKKPSSKDKNAQPKVVEQPEVSKKPSSKDKKAQPHETSEVNEAFAHLKARADALRE